MGEKRELLKKLRGHLAYAKQCEPFKIFRNVEFEALMEKQPKTIEELSEIKGFPKDGKRVTCWGEAIVKIFAEPEQIKDFEVTLDAEGFPISSIVLKKMELF